MELTRRIATPDWGTRGRARRLALARSGPQHADEDTVRHLMDVAHAALGSEDLAAVLVVVLRDSELISRGSVPARPRGRLREGRPSLTPAARAFMRPIRLALDDVAREARRVGTDEVVAFGERVRAHAEFLAALPRGCAVAVTSM